MTNGAADQTYQGGTKATGWSRQSMLKALQRASHETDGRVQITDLSDGPYPSSASFQREFDSFSEALLAVGLPINKPSNIDIPIPTNVNGAGYKEVYKNGFRAALEGKSRDANGYDSARYAPYWQRGWTAGMAYREAVSEQ